MTSKMTFVLSFVLILLACKPQWSQPTPGLISVAESHQLVKHVDPIIIDVRTPQEVEQGAIEGALSININANDFTKKIAKLDTADTYLVYCKKGSRSDRALNMMKDMGFKKVYDLEGGFDKWITQK